VQEPCRPRPCHIPGDKPCVVGIDAVDNKLYWRAAGFPHAAAEVFPEVYDALDKTLPHRVFRGPHIGEADRAEITRLPEHPGETRGVRIRLLNNQCDGNMFRIERYPIAEEDQEDYRH
jgi:hypothetical protein